MEHSVKTLFVQRITNEVARTSVIVLILMVLIFYLYKHLERESTLRQNANTVNITTMELRIQSLEKQNYDCRVNKENAFFKIVTDNTQVLRGVQKTLDNLAK